MSVSVPNIIIHDLMQVLYVRVSCFVVPWMWCLEEVYRWYANCVNAYLDHGQVLCCDVLMGDVVVSFQDLWKYSGVDSNGNVLMVEGMSVVVNVMFGTLIECNEPITALCNQSVHDGGEVMYMAWFHELSVLLCGTAIRCNCKLCYFVLERFVD